MAKLTALECQEKAKRLDNWLMFDLTLWSDDPEFEKLVDQVFNSLAKRPGFAARKNVRKLHLKLVLLNLYKAWSADPSMYIGYHRGNSYYSRIPSRYNPNNIKQTTISVISTMIDVGFLENEKGCYFEGHRRAIIYLSHAARH